MTTDSLVPQTRPRTPSPPQRTEPGSCLFIFFLATYAITWVCWIPIIAVPIADGTLSRSILVLVGTFAPALVGLALTAKYEARSGIETMFRRVLQWEVAARWYLLAITYMAVVKLIAALVYRLFTGSWPQFGNDPWYLLIIAMIFSTPVQSGEEIGWRGYALPRLAERMGFARASVLLGMIWAAWHLPIFFIPGADKYGQAFPVWALAVTAASVAITWLYVHTGGSLLLTMLMHAAINNTSGIVPATSAPMTNPFTFKASHILWLTTGLLWIPGLYFLARMPKALATPAREGF